MQQQTRWQSFKESCWNILIGYTVNLLANLWIFPLFGFHISIWQNLQMGVIYTVISIVRSYAIRRWHNFKQATT